METPQSLAAHCAEMYRLSNERDEFLEALAIAFELEPEQFTTEHLMKYVAELEEEETNANDEISDLRKANSDLENKLEKDQAEIKELKRRVEYLTACDPVNK